MTQHPVSGRVGAKVELSAQIAVQHTGGWTWESHWLLVTKYLTRLHEIYDGAHLESNTDLWAIVNSFMIDCYHLREVFSHQPGLGAAADSTALGSPELQLCRDYANTWKHFHRDQNVRVAFIWETGDSANGGQYVRIAHRLRDDLASTQTVVDGLVLARAAWEAWRAFMARNGLAEPIELTQPYLTKLMGPQKT